MDRGRMLARVIAAAFIAIMLAGPGGAVFPSTLRWGAWAACPAGMKPEPETFRASYSRPGEREVRLVCVSPDGRRESHTGMAIVGLFAKYFVALTLLFTLLSLRKRTATSAVGGATGALRSVPPDVEAKARVLLDRDQKIVAIKLVREASGMGLKEAKDWVEALPSSPPLPPPSAPPAADASLAAVTPAADRLLELKRLADAGLITAAEYEAKKAEILAGL